MFHEARRSLPSIIYIPHIDQWWLTISDTLRATFMSLLLDLDPASPLLFLATSDIPYDQLDSEVRLISLLICKTGYTPHSPDVMSHTHGGKNNFQSRCGYRNKIFKSLYPKTRLQCVWSLLALQFHHWTHVHLSVNVCFFYFMITYLVFFFNEYY